MKMIAMVKSRLAWTSAVALCCLSSVSIKAQDSLDVQSLGQLSYSLTLNDVWGWADTATGKEYALVGVQNGLSVVDVSIPSNPVQTNFFAGASSTWRDMKTFGNYAYTVHDVFNGTSDGIFILDMTTIGTQFPTYYRRNPVIQVGQSTGTLERAHNLFIDENGYLYLFGANVGQGGALIFDLNTSPTNPTYVGAFDDFYLHDGVVRGDTLWGAAVLNGFFMPIDVSQKSQPTISATQTTPFNFTHNIWFSDDNQRVFTTDEKSGAFIAEYDVSDLGNISETDRIRTSFGTDVIPHNVHFHNNFLVNSYYTAGLQILDVSQPGLMIETGFYDTSPTNGNGFSGCWGAYPYLPSGNILATDRQQGLFVLSSNYSRGCYFNATVIDSVSRQNIIIANVEVLTTDMIGTTNIFGNFRAGQAQGGTFQVVVAKAGYETDTFSISLTNGVLLNKQFALLPFGISRSEQELLNNISIYPNPAQSLVKVDGFLGSGKNLKWSLTDLRGRLIQHGDLDAGGSKEINFGEHLKGYYLLQLHTELAAKTFSLSIE
jgi:choice-of-anchor B domain-containing protein